MKTQRERDKGTRENEERDQPVCLLVCSSVSLSVSFLALMTSPHDQCTPENSRSPSLGTAIFSLSASSKSLPFFSASVPIALSFF